jgi:hypothetical protein
LRNNSRPGTWKYDEGFALGEIKLAVGFVIALIFFVAIIIAYASDKEGRDRYYQLEHKRRFGGKKLSPEDQAEWEKLCRKFRW